jgi:hypothetical protein
MRSYSDFYYVKVFCPDEGIIKDVFCTEMVISMVELYFVRYEYVDGGN